jgi:putative transposase
MKKSVPYGHRRIHPRVFGDRRLWEHSFGRVIELLSKLVSSHGAPSYLRSHNGPEFVSRAVLHWLTQANFDPGKPWQNGSNESFSYKFRDECLSLQWLKEPGSRISEVIIGLKKAAGHYRRLKPRPSGSSG